MEELAVSVRPGGGTPFETGETSVEIVMLASAIDAREEGRLVGRLVGTEVSAVGENTVLRKKEREISKNLSEVIRRRFEVRNNEEKEVNTAVRWTLGYL